jgi:1-acyl-sn-glycerol-3-phosphate acyltransferase
MSKLSEWLLRLFGWKCVGDAPTMSHCVLIVAPHTSNWDFVIAVLFKISRKLDLKYFGKDSLFKWYNGWFFKFFGGMPVNKKSPKSSVINKVNCIKNSSRFWLALAPEGTRSCLKYWRSGFYHIARSAEIPLVLVFIDAKTKTVGIGPTIELTGNIKQDMDVIRDFYADKIGINPNLTAPIQLKDEFK